MNYVCSSKFKEALARHWHIRASEAFSSCLFMNGAGMIQVVINRYSFKNSGDSGRHYDAAETVDGIKSIGWAFLGQKNRCGKQKEKKIVTSLAGNRTLGCCVKDSDVSHYTTRDDTRKEKLEKLALLPKKQSCLWLASHGIAGLHCSDAQSAHHHYKQLSHSPSAAAYRGK
ncbi:predicted protein [Histoplasma capsulatum H143]|uniref:Uncharacterized protein n=1 Tax=Ajellomyces capsulatus (strain H143) TaxID=544712 RepID=C6HQ44_AJECH|nr:predicted protein [Histoplasma capsulatum H143]